MMKHLLVVDMISTYHPFEIGHVHMTGHLKVIVVLRLTSTYIFHSSPTGNWKHSPDSMSST